MVNNLKVELESRVDSNDQVYFLGRLRFPGVIDCRKGVTFLAFTSDIGEEELQIAVNDNINSTFSRFSRKQDRLKLSVEGREDQYGKIYYVGKLQLDGSIKFDPEVVFILFTSKVGAEELQIVCNVVNQQGQKYSEEDEEFVELYPKRLRTVSVG